MSKETMSCVSQQHIALHSLAQRLGKLWQHTYQCMGSFARVIWTQVRPFPALPVVLVLRELMTHEVQ